jgi:hypothetical protein
VTFLGRERRHAVFQFSHTHLDIMLPSLASDFKSGLPSNLIGKSSAGGTATPETKLGFSPSKILF